MKFVVIFGPPAVGKMSVGYELAKLTGLKLFHNHMTIDLVLNFLSLESPRSIDWFLNSAGGYSKKWLPATYQVSSLLLCGHWILILKRNTSIGFVRFFVIEVPMSILSNSKQISMRD